LIDGRTQFADALAISSFSRLTPAALRG